MSGSEKVNTPFKQKGTTEQSENESLRILTAFKQVVKSQSMIIRQEDINISTQGSYNILPKRSIGSRGGGARGEELPTY